MQLSLNKNRLASVGSNFCDHTKLGFKDAAALEKAHKIVDLKYLRQTNRTAVRILRDAVFDHPTKETAAVTKLHSILQNNEASNILRGAVDDDDYVQVDRRTVADPGCADLGQDMQLCHKCEGMTDMLTGSRSRSMAVALRGQEFGVTMSEPLPCMWLSSRSPPSLRFLSLRRTLV